MEIKILIIISVIFALFLGFLLYLLVIARRKILEMQVQFESEKAEIFRQAEERASSSALAMFNEQKGSLENAYEEKYKGKFAEWKQETEGNIRKDSLQKSRTVIKANVTEQLLPILPSFAYNTSDARFLGNPIDYIIFDGYTEAKDAGIPEIREIIFVDVKQGNASLNRVQKLIKEAVEFGRIRWATMQLSGETIIESSTNFENEKNNENIENDLCKQAYMLGESNDSEAIPKLIALTQHKNGNVRRLAASALGKLSSKKPHIFQSVSCLVALLEDEGPQIRQCAVKALEKIGDTSVLTTLNKLIDDPINYVSDAAKRAITKLS